jgi:hypothetical protein
MGGSEHGADSPIARGDEATGRRDRVKAIDPLRAAAMSWWLALVAIWVVQEAHAGQHELHELPPILHAVRDAALAVPLAAGAVVIGTILVSPRLRPRDERTPAGTGDGGRISWVGAVALAFAAASIPGHELHGALFGVEQSDVGWLAHALLDASIAGFGAVLALFPVAMVVGPPIRRATPDHDTTTEAKASLRTIPVSTGRSER